MTAPEETQPAGTQPVATGPAGAGAGPAGTVLEVRDLHVRITSRQGTVRAVDGVSFDVGAGEALGLVGESGSGKSMTLRAVLGVLPPEARVTSGEILLDGVNLVTRPHSELNRIRGRKMSMIFQEPMSALNPVMRVGRQIAEGPQVQLGFSRAKAAERALELMRRVGIPDPERRFRAYPHEFSGGMRQRVMIAIALSCDPEIILCDEPTTALDVVVQRDILAQIVELKQALGFAILFITHDLSLLLELADQIAVMYAGQLLEVGTAEEIKREPSHPYTRGLLTSFPSLRGPRRELAGIPGSPPDLRDPPPGCPFMPRCGYARPACAEVDMALAPVVGSADPWHVTACPFVGPETRPETGPETGPEGARS